MITTEQSKHGIEVFANGERFVIITDETDRAALVKFVELCEANQQLPALVSAAKERRDWNMNSNGQGKDWPVFRQLERLVSKLCKEAGIVDS